jgi:trehalose synthase
MDPRRFASVLSDGEYEALLGLGDGGRRELRSRVIWNVNSTAKGGGVAELLRPLLGYSRGAGVDARWLVISGDSEFFEVTKRLHNNLHGVDGDGGPLGDPEHSVYERTLAESSAELVELVHPRDVVILHDPQTAGLVEAVRRTGAIVIWRCHVGLDLTNERAREAWTFLRPYLTDADAYVFSRATFAWEGLAREKIAVIRPSIDVFSAKNAGQSLEQSSSILSMAGITPHRAGEDASFVRCDGTPGRVNCRVEMVEDAPLRPEDRVVTQVSRWDLLKDPLGVLGGFAQHIAAQTNVHLMLAGPAPESVSDDPEGAGVFATVRHARHELSVEVRQRVHLASVPMDDVEENAAIVNALQRLADVVIQKSLAEGFGLTVAEAMWKARPVVASRVGGIRDQIVHGRSGMLISDPSDLVEFATAVAGLLAEPDRARRMGDAAHTSVQDHFLGSQHLGRYFEVIERLLTRREGHHQRSGSHATEAQP